jgi:lysophospholipase L1-like esterase
MGTRIMHAMLAGRRANLVTQPYQKKLKEAHTHIVIFGDSTMYGAGIKDPHNTMGGLLARAYPKASVETLAYNGAKVKDLRAQLKMTDEEHYAIMMVGIGGNDIVGLTSFAQIKESLQAFLEEAIQKADIIVLFHCVNMGNIGFFLPPLNYFYDNRTRKLSELYKKITAEYKTVYYVNFYRSKSQDFYTQKTRKKFIADDSFHPSDYANQYFFNLICEQVPELTSLKTVNS